MFSLRRIRTADDALAGQIIALYSAQGWWTRGEGPRELRRLIKGSALFLCAFSGGRLAGMGRAISDGVSDAYIQDVAVARGLRGNGIGAALVRSLVSRLKRRGVRWVGLVAQDGSEKFYRPLGFRPIAGARPMMLKGNRV